ncbi:MAG: hypothetical protein LW807_07655 [Proteobacteria bacterium]|jgi:hypothetical protein|nr:hypothetical protein [Pseudomonadota bacterium]
MNAKKLQIESLILVALAKHFNSQGTYLIGELKQQTKMNFNVAMSATNNFVNGIEKGLLPDEKKFLDDLVGVMDDALFEMRKDLDKQNINQ